MTDEFQLISSTVRHLKDGDDLTPWKLGCHRNQHLTSLVHKQIDIWIDCTPTHRTFHPVDKSCTSFLNALLASANGEFMLKSRVALARELFQNHLPTPMDATVLGRWCELVADVIATFRLNQEEGILEMMLKLCDSLVSHFGVFQSLQLRQHVEANQLAVKICTKVILENLTTVSGSIREYPVKNNCTTVSGTIGKSPAEHNWSLIKGIQLLVENLNKCSQTGDKLDTRSFMIQYISELFKDKTIRQQNVKIKEILDVVYITSKEHDERDKVFSLTEKAFLERCLQHKTCCQNNKNVVILFDAIKRIKKEATSYNLNGANSTQSRDLANRFVYLIGFESCFNPEEMIGYECVFHKEEMQYIAIIGADLAKHVLLTHQPATYLHVFKDLAVNGIYRKLICHFHSAADHSIIDLLESYKYDVQNFTDVSSTDDRCQQILHFKRSFNRAYFFVKRNNTTFEWLLWLQETILKSLGSVRPDLVTLSTLTELILITAEYPPDQLFLSTTASRPYRWMDDILVTSIMKTVAKLDEKTPKNENERKEQCRVLNLSLHKFLKVPYLEGRAILTVLLHKLERDVQLVAVSESVDSAYITSLVSELQTLIHVDNMNRFRDSSLQQWPRLIRHLKLAEVWPSGLADQLTTILDRRLGKEKTDLFLQQFIYKYSIEPNKLTTENFEQLEVVIKNLSKYPWIIEYFITLTEVYGNYPGNRLEQKGCDSIWELIQNRKLIEEDRLRTSQVNLSADDILKSMLNDPDSKVIIANDEQREKLAQQIFDIRRLATIKHENNWTLEKIEKWTSDLKKFQRTVEPVEFLSVAMLAVDLKMNCQLRDSQLLAILIFVSPPQTLADTTQCKNVQRRMAQISTGEGKTLITALLVAYHVLSNWSNGRRSVDIITSSSVLAIANVEEMKWFYTIFGISVENNCDAACSDDENLRRRRYNNDVIYGDLSSFQRDILLSRFISNRDITCNRLTGAVVVDEVDSMLLDKGENILYLSHKIPEMDDLMQVFVEIWNAVHDPLAATGDEEAQAAVVNFLKKRIESDELPVPKCLKSFVLRYLLAWTRNALRAKYLVTTKDTYKVDDIGDGRGQQIIIMDKETGVEQVQMQWSHGLHQFLQLKHSLKLSPVSLKAVFMSNIGFFEQRREAALYGMTGTLGSTAECQLLHQVFHVDFFKLPRFRRRFCIEEDHILSASRKQWLDDIVLAVKAQLDCGRAVLIVCENIAAADEAYSKLIFASNQKKINCNATKYISSVDKDFQKQQHESELKPGQVIVATNLAGRGTDFKISDSLAGNGGLHVIIGYMPANARVEAQIEGRVARAGQPGSFQFVMWDSSVSPERTDVTSELSRLKIKRDDQECRRLESIRTRGLQKIFLEEKLFERFHKEVYDKMKRSQLDHPDVELQLKFLTNRWALWLDENAHNIENNHTSKTVEANFNSFKEECLSIKSSTSTVGFASTPSELLSLGKFSDNADEPNDISERCYKKIIADEPTACEIALIHRAKLVMNTAGEIPSKKSEAKHLLTRANDLLSDKISRLLAANSMIKRTSDMHKTSGAAIVAENRFDEQTTNLVSLLQVHKTAIDDILGRSISSSIAMHFTDEEEARAVADIVTDTLSDKGLCKPYRLSKKTTAKSADSNNEAEDESMLWMNYRDPNQRLVNWPSELAQYRQDTIQLIADNRCCLLQSFPKEKLAAVIVTQNNLWQVLIEEGLIGDQLKIERDVIRWKDRHLNDESDVNAWLQMIPHDLVKLNIILIDWLCKHDDEDFTEAVTTLSLTNEQTQLLNTFLKNERVLVHLSEERGRLQKEITCKVEHYCYSGVDGLPENMAKYEHILAAWILKDEEVVKDRVKELGEWVSREELPCPSDAKDSVQLLFNHLVSEGVIKEPVVLLKTVKEDVDNCFQNITDTINGPATADELKVICMKYRPPPKPVTTHSYLDKPSWWAHQAWTGIGDAANYFYPYSAKSTDGEIRPANIDEWLTEKQNMEHVECYRNDVVQALKNSLGKLKTIPKLSASFQPLSEYFKSDQSRTYPVDELQSLADKSFTGVIKLEAVKSWWDYWDRRALLVALAGVTQIAAGVALTAFSGGLLGAVGSGLIAEGAGDMMFAVQSSLTGSFSWKSYREHKKWSLLMTVATAGLGAYLTKGATVGRLATMGFQGKAGFSLIWAATKTVLTKCGRAILSTLTNMGTEKLLTWLKKFVIDNILVHVKFLISKALSFLFNALSKALDQIWTAMKNMGRRVEEIKYVIDEQLDKVKSSELFTLWGRQVIGQANSVGSAIGRCFSESSDILRAEGRNDLFELGKASGNNVLIKSFNVVECAGKASKILKWVKNGTEIAGLIAYGPEYVNNIRCTLEAKANSLKEAEQENQSSKRSDKVEAENASQQQDSDETEKHQAYVEQDSNNIMVMTDASVTLESETKVFNQYKEEVRKRIEGEVVTYLVDSVTNTWVQPWLQSKIEHLVISAGKKTCQCIGSLWQGANQGSETTYGTQPIDGEEATNAQSERQAAVTEKKLGDAIGEGNTQQETDSYGNVNVQPKNFQEVVESMGNGQTAGLLQMQMVSNATNYTIEIIDTTVDQDFKSETGRFTITPEGDSIGTIKLIYTENEDGTKHVSLIGPDGKKMDSSFTNADGTPAPPNRCLYEAVALAKNCSVDQLLTDVKEHARSDKMAQYLYDAGVDDALPHMRVGTQKRADIFYYEDEQGNHHFLSTLTEKNLAGGTRVSSAARKDLEGSKLGTDHSGHLLARLLGGGGGKKSNNIVNMAQSLNQGEYRRCERLIAEQLRKNPGAIIDLDITLNANALGNVDLRRPVSFRLSWRLTTADNKTTYFESELLYNNQSYNNAGTLEALQTPTRKIHAMKRDAESRTPTVARIEGGQGTERITDSYVTPANKFNRKRNTNP